MNSESAKKYNRLLACTAPIEVSVVEDPDGRLLKFVQHSAVWGMNLQKIVAGLMKKYHESAVVEELVHAARSRRAADCERPKTKAYPRTKFCPYGYVKVRMSPLVEILWARYETLIRADLNAVRLDCLARYEAYRAQCEAGTAAPPADGQLPRP